MNNEIKIGTKIKALVYWVCSKFSSDQWELMPEGFEPKTEITNTFGLKIGDELPTEIISKWEQNGLNVNIYEKWEKGRGGYISNRVIKSFKLIDNILGFEVSDTKNIYLKAEGFKEFMDSFDKKESEFKKGDYIAEESILSIRTTKPKLTITDIPTTQPIVIKLNKKINYLIPKSI